MKLQLIIWNGFKNFDDQISLKTWILRLCSKPYRQTPQLSLRAQHLIIQQASHLQPSNFVSRYGNIAKSWTHPSNVYVFANFCLFQILWVSMYVVWVCLAIWVTRWPCCLLYGWARVARSIGLATSVKAAWHWDREAGFNVMRAETGTPRASVDRTPWLKPSSEGRGLSPGARGAHSLGNSEGTRSIF